MTERRMRASNPEFQEMDMIQKLLILLRNPEMNHGIINDLPEAERKALIEKLEELQQEYIDTGSFADFVNRALNLDGI